MANETKWSVSIEFSDTLTGHSIYCAEYDNMTDAIVYAKQVQRYKTSKTDSLSDYEKFHSCVYITDGSGDGYTLEFDAKFDEVTYPELLVMLEFKKVGLAEIFDDNVNSLNPSLYKGGVNIPENWIYKAFPWGDTKEGADFWHFFMMLLEFKTI